MAAGTGLGHGRTRPDKPKLLDRHWVLPTAVATAVSLVTVARLGPHGWRVVYWEDGPLMLEGWRARGLSCLIEPHGGYLHTVPRLVASPGTFLPLGWWSYYAVVADALTVGGLAAFVAVRARRLTGPPGVIVASVAFGLVPGLGGSSIGAISYLQFFLVAATFWAMLCPGRGSVLVAVGTGLSTALGVLTLPALLVGRRRALPAASALVVATAANLLVSRVGLRDRLPMSRTAGVPPIGWLLTWWLSDVAGSPGTWAGAAAGLAVCVLAALRVHGAEARLPALVALSCGVLVYVTTALLNDATYPRYTACSSLLLWSAVGLALDRMTRTSWILVTVMAGCAVVAFPAIPRRVDYPSWQDAVARRPSACSPIVFNGSALYAVRLPCALKHDSPDRTSRVTSPSGPHPNV